MRAVMWLRSRLPVSVTAGEYTVTATINLAGAVTTVSVPLTLTAGQPVIDGLRRKLVPYILTANNSAPGVMLEKSSRQVGPLP